jgi:hypothetical protein
MNKYLCYVIFKMQRQSTQGNEQKNKQKLYGLMDFSLYRNNE